jgi:hypothetical protein
MPDPEKVATVVWEWVAKAENELKAADQQNRSALRLLEENGLAWAKATARN